MDVIIPMYDDSAELLSRNKAMFEARFAVRCAVPDFPVFDKAHDKQKLMEFCRKRGFPHPATARLSEENIEMAAGYVGFPAIIKPNISAGARGIVQVDSIEDIHRKFPVIYRQFGACTLQHFINHSGVYYNVMLYRSARGHLAGQTVLKIMRYFPLKGGTSCYCETIRHDALMRICARVLDELQWVGFADFDIMEEKDKFSGYYRTGCHGRVRGAVGLSSGRIASVYGIGFHVVPVLCGPVSIQTLLVPILWPECPLSGREFQRSVTYVNGVCIRHSEIFASGIS